MRGWKMFVLNGMVGGVIFVIEFLIFVGVVDWQVILLLEWVVIVVLVVGVVNIVLCYVISGLVGWCDCNNLK